MNNVPKEPHDYFYCEQENTPQARRIETNHRLLIQRLSKRNRKLVLRIIDDKDQICTNVSLDSFTCGFRLAWQIANQIQNYDGCSDCNRRINSREKTSVITA
ncbi:hypothetical protein Psfp_00387 [Pelotomaculum sp. FP]|nr:hypothetical protein Psfp_00387 [Pelotomaculum sp. FP]